jgi:hypothetical protein
MSYFYKDANINTIIEPGNTSAGGNYFIGFPTSYRNTPAYTIERPKPLSYRILGSDLSNNTTAQFTTYNNTQSKNITIPTPQSIYNPIIPTGAKLISVICVGGGGGGGHGGRGYYNSIYGTGKGGNGGNGGNGNYSAVEYYPVNSSNTSITIYSGGLGPQGVNDNAPGLPGTASQVVVGNQTICLAPAGNGGKGGNDGGKAGKNGDNGANGTSPVGTINASGITSYSGANNFYPPPTPGFGTGGVGGNGGNKSGGNQGTSGTSGYVTIYYYFE